MVMLSASLHAGHPIPIRLGAGREPAESGVDMQPEVVFVAQCGHGLQIIVVDCVDGAGIGDNHTGFAVLLRQRTAQRLDIDGLAAAGQRCHRHVIAPADAQHAQRFWDAAVNLAAQDLDRTDGVKSILRPRSDPVAG